MKQGWQSWRSDASQAHVHVCKALDGKALLPDDNLFQVAQVPMQVRRVHL